MCSSDPEWAQTLCSLAHWMCPSIQILLYFYAVPLSLSTSTLAAASTLIFALLKLLQIPAAPAQLIICTCAPHNANAAAQPSKDEKIQVQNVNPKGFANFGWTCCFRFFSLSLLQFLQLFPTLILENSSSSSFDLLRRKLHFCNFLHLPLLLKSPKSYYH